IIYVCLKSYSFAANACTSAQKSSVDCVVINTFRPFKDTRLPFFSQPSYMIECATSICFLFLVDRTYTPSATAYRKSTFLASGRTSDSEISLKFTDFPMENRKLKAAKDCKKSNIM